MCSCSTKGQARLEIEAEEEAVEEVGRGGYIFLFF